MNNVQLIGRLGRDPELRFTPQGTPVAGFSLAVNERRKDQEVTHWFQIVAWGPLGQTVAEHKVKGDQVAISGRLRYREWDKDGEHRSTVEVVAENIEFLARKQPDEPTHPAYNGEEEPF